MKRGSETTTLEEIKALSDDELRIKVAELLGWKDVRNMEYTCACAPAGVCEHCQAKLCGWDRRGGLIDSLRTGCYISGHVPDYPRDLNACHEMESWFWHRYAGSEFKWGEYVRNLISVCGHPSNQHHCRATARQRCEAYVLTMEQWI